MNTMWTCTPLHYPTQEPSAESKARKKKITDLERKLQALNYNRLPEHVKSLSQSCSPRPKHLQKLLCQSPTDTSIWTNAREIALLVTNDLTFTS